MATHTKETLPDYPLSIGISLDRLDSSVVLASTYLFPKERGRTLLVVLLRQGEVKPIPLGKTGEVVDCVVISLASVEVFAREQHMSKDTVLRYLEIWQALGMLHRMRQKNQTLLCFPLAAWVPTPEAVAHLDALITGDVRPRLQQLARSVKERFQLLYGSPASWLKGKEYIQDTLVDVREHLSKRESSSKRHLLQLRIDQAVLWLAQQGDFSRCQACPLHTERSQQGDFPSATRRDSARLEAQEGDFQTTMTEKEADAQRAQGKNGSTLTEKGDLAPGVHLVHEQSSAQEGDFGSGQHPKCGELSAQEGDLPNGPGGQTGGMSAQEGDFPLSASGSQGHLQAEKGDFQGALREKTTEKGDFGSGQHLNHEELSAEKGDFQGQRGNIAAQEGDVAHGVASLSLNVNEESLGRNGDFPLTFNDSKSPLTSTTTSADRYAPEERQSIAFQLAMFVEHSPKNLPFYVTACKQYPRAIIRAAVVDLLVHTHFPAVNPRDRRGKPRNRGAWFTKACSDYAQPGATIPAFVQVWLAGSLVWEHIDEQLQQAAARYGHHLAAENVEADLVRSFLRGECSEQELDAALQVQGEKPIRPPLEADAGAMPATAVKGWMDEAEARVLAGRMLQEGVQIGVNKATPVQEHGVWVVMGRCQTTRITMRTPQQWEKYLPGVLRARQRKEQYQQEQVAKGARNGTHA